MNIVTAVRRRLRESAQLTGIARIDKNRLLAEVAGTGEVAVVVSYNASWRSTPQTAKFPRIGITIHADPSRLDDGSIKAEDAYDRAMEAYELIDAIMHRTHTESVVWGGDGGVRVLMSMRETEPSDIDRPGDSVAMLRATYDLQTG